MSERGGLERRYRRLLAWYPRDYRDAYGDEILGVLLECAGPERHRPTVTETADLLVGALRYRLRRLPGKLGPAWRDAGAVASLVAPLLLLALRLNALLSLVPVRREFYGDIPPVGPSVWVPTAVWALVVLAALTDLRRTAAALAWTGLVVEVGGVGLLYHRFGPLYLPLWTLLFATIAALGLTLTEGARRGVRLLGTVGIPALAVATALLAFGSWLYGALSVTTMLGTLPMQWLLSPRVLAVPVGVFVLLRLPRPLRRRVLVLIVPVFVYTVTQGVLDGYVGAGSYSAGRWTYVAPLAPVALAVGALLLGRALVCRMERAPVPAGAPQGTVDAPQRTADAPQATEGG